MKLFVWCDPYPVSYGSSMAFAVAETVEEAREQLARGKAYTFGQYEQDDGGAQQIALKNKPDRVVDLPCAEWHEWSE